MFSAREYMKNRLQSLNSRLSDQFDLDFSSVTERIETVEEFESEIKQPFLSDKKVFFRGERINDPQRRLVPNILRNPQKLLNNGDMAFVHIDAAFMLGYYSGLGSFVDVFSKTMGEVSENNLYELCAFAQHYYNFSPLIDFSKSIYPSLSFALKNREVYEDDIVLYMLELKNDCDYTTDISKANEWLSDLSIYASYFDEKDLKNVVKDVIETKKIYKNDELRKHLENINRIPVPSAKLIDVPTNTRMKFQQGVFLLLDKFHFFNDSYFTKNIRDDFEITKFVISKNICPELLAMIKQETPWYSYEYLTDIEGAFKVAVNKK